MSGKGNRTRRGWLGAVLGLAALAPLRRAEAHKFHFSSTLLEYNPQTKSYEITVRLFADDLEEALGRRAGKRVEIDRSADAEPLSYAYLKEKLRLRGPDMQPIALHWVGLEVKVQTVYCYLEAPAPESGVRNLAVANSIFFDLLPGQVNTVLLKDPVHGRPRDLVFRDGDRFRVVIFPEPEEHGAAGEKR